MSSTPFDKNCARALEARQDISIARDALERADPNDYIAKALYWLERARRRLDYHRSFGVYFKECRIATGKTLRVFCLEHGFDPGNLSKLECGLMQPPDSMSKLAEYATSLGLQLGSSEWIEYFDLARKEQGEQKT